MIDDVMDRARLTWEGLNERERMLSLGLGGTFLALLLGLPIYLMVDANSVLAMENQAMRATLVELAEKRVPLQRASEERRSSNERYKHKTPPLGSFLESEAKKQGMTVKEVTDQPEKAIGKYHRRNVKASIPKVGLTPTINLLSSIVTSEYPVAIDHIQIEHFQPGDEYNVKVGVLTFDKKGAAQQGAKPEKAE